MNRGLFFNDQGKKGQWRQRTEHGKGMEVEPGSPSHLECGA